MAVVNPLFKVGRLLPIMLLALLVGLVGEVADVQAAGPGRAGLVVRFGDGSVATRCVSFAEQEISGYELLTRSGLAFEAAQNDGSGAAVCKIEGEGCPTSNCFCNFPPNYWAYWIGGEGGWQLASVGASARKLRNGAVDGWVWGGGTSPPSALSFGDICRTSVYLPLVVGG